MANSDYLESEGDSDEFRIDPVAVLVNRPWDLPPDVQFEDFIRRIEYYQEDHNDIIALSKAINDAEEGKIESETQGLWSRFKRCLTLS